MKPSILIIEDDPSIVLGLRINLSKAGFTVRTAADGHIGLAELARERPDLVLLDLMLPGVDGLEILRQIRGHDGTLPVVVLTALGAEDDKVRGLDLGANDYVTKPFSVAELVARVRAALRTASLGPSSIGGDVLRAGSIELNRDHREVRIGDEQVDLRGKEFDLLRFLMERPERVLTREQILTNVWGQDY
ncbi:MAG: response regulator transcription factor, partial [Myxococcota bacterium]|nr:response regulator transcription factor [Myxococcota bacterium]